MSKKTVDLNEYKKSQEDIEAMALDIPDELINEYIKEVEINTPDLWSAIEAGYEKEINLIDSENRARRRKTIGFIAAAVVIIVIAVPVAIFNVTGKKDKKSDKTKNDDFTLNTKDYSYDYIMEETEACEDSDEYKPSDSMNYNYDAQINGSDLKGSEKEDAAEATTEAATEAATETTTEAAADEGISEEDIANEIVVDGIVYVDSGNDFTDTVPGDFSFEKKIQNRFCRFPEKELTILYDPTSDSASQIYVRYNNLYRLYERSN